MPVEELPSIHNLPPLDQGGAIARAGFLYQDHVGARFCIEMLRNAKLAGVWCETLDDITLIWDDCGQPKVEFVQVKSNDLTQMWSVALICAGGKDSIVAHSLAQHRCNEPCCFRIVTRVGVNGDLRVLLLSRDRADRSIGNTIVLLLHKQIEGYLDGFHSVGGWSASAWVGHTLWEVAESEAAVERSNLLNLERWLEEIGEPLFSDQRSELYTRILTLVYKASALPHQAAPRKKFARAPYHDWAVSQAQQIKGTAATKTGTNLTRKMQSANIPNSAVQNALGLRMAFRGKMLTPKYQQEEEHKTAELELTAKLQQLVAQLDIGSLEMTGPEFHARCLDAASELRERFANVDLSFLQGSMYSMTDRCRHRFLPATLL
jgi:hypothetical protein